MTTEELMVCHLVQMLPAPYRKELRDGLRILHPKKDKAAFTVEEVRKVFNDTIAVIQEDNKEQNKSTLSFHNKNYQNDKRGKRNKPAPTKQVQNNQTPDNVNETPLASSEPPQQTPQSYAQGRSQGQQDRYDTRTYYRQDEHNRAEQGRYYREQDRNSGYNQYREQDWNYNAQQQPDQGNFRGGRGFRGNRGVRGGRGDRGRGRGGWTQWLPKRPTRCYVCMDNSKWNHSSFTCPNFKTAVAKREHLAATGRCICCCREIHQGECDMYNKCPLHPGEAHYAYLCGGNQHPGKNA